MRIGFDAKRAFCNFRGLGNYSRSLISSLVHNYPDNEFHLFSPKVKQDFNHFLMHERQVQRHLPATYFFEKIHPLWRSFGMAKDIRETKVDIFHGLSHELPKGLNGNWPRTIVTIHDLMYIHFPHFFPWIDRRTYDRKVRYACESSDSIIAICEQTKSDLINFYKVNPQKIKVIYQSIGDQFFENSGEKYNLPKSAKDKGFILGVGAFVANKNFETLIKAFARISKILPLELVLIGFGSEKTIKGYRALAQELGIAKRLHILNDVPTSQLPSLYKDATVFCLPSFHEGFGIPIIEAMASGTPVVTTMGAAHEEAAGGIGQFIDPKSYENISEKILQLVENKELYVQLSQKGVQHAQSFHSKVVAGNLFKHYENLTSS